MTGAYAYTPEIWPPLAAAIFLAALGLYSWRRRDVPAARWLAICALITILWLLGIALEAAAVAPATRILWRKFTAACQVPAMTAVTCFVLEYSYPGRWLTRRNLTLLWLIPLLPMLLVAVSGGQLVYRILEVGPAGNVVLRLTTLGLVVVTYGIGLVLINVTALLWLFIRSPQHRWPAALMIFSQIVARGLYVANVANPSGRFPVDPVVAGIVLGWIIYAIALFGFRIFDPSPAARRQLCSRCAGRRGVRRRLAGAEPEPGRGGHFRCQHRRCSRQTWQQLAPSQEALPALFDAGEASRDLALAAPELPEMVFGSGAGARHYAPALSVLRDARGLILGHLLILRDVTEERRAQARSWNSSARWPRCRNASGWPVSCTTASDRCSATPASR